MSATLCPATRTPRSCIPWSNLRDATVAEFRLWSQQTVLPIATPKIKATLVNNQFSSAFAADHSHLPSMCGEPFSTMHSFTITGEGVKKLLSNLDAHKATGPDSIPSRFLKEYADKISLALTLIFQASLRQSEVPQDWRQAYVAPIFKKDDRRSPANYRPISLISVCSNVMEHILLSQVKQHLEAHGTLSDQQHGFRKGRSCERQLILTLQDLVAGMDEGQQIDTLTRRSTRCRMSALLRHYVIQDNLLKWSQSFPRDRSQQVRVEGRSSTPVPVVSGVPQGTVLGPLLYNYTPMTCLRKLAPLPTYLLMIASCTSRFQVQLIQQRCRRIWTSSGSGNRTGRCHFTLVNAK